MPTDFVRPLTHDERHAAEAAFTNQPIDPRWSNRAHYVYRQLRAAILQRHGRPSIEDGPVATPQPQGIPARDIFHVTPFHLRPVLVWRIIFQDTKEEQLRLFPGHFTVTAIVQAMKQDVPTRPFTMHMVQFGSFPLRRDGLVFFTRDARQIDQDGHVHMPIRSEPPTSPTG
jgi:hypothetical protein